MYGAFCANRFTIFYWYYRPSLQDQFIQGIPLTGWGFFYCTTFNGVCLLAVIAHIRAAFSDPGRIPEGLKAPFQSEYMELKFCEKCKGKETWKPVRAHHCSTCGYCVFKVSGLPTLLIYRCNYRLDGPSLSLDQQLCRTQKHEVLFAIRSIHHDIFHLPLLTDGPVVLLTPNC